MRRAAALALPLLALILLALGATDPYLGHAVAGEAAQEPPPGRWERLWPNATAPRLRMVNRYRCHASAVQEFAWVAPREETPACRVSETRGRSCRFRGLWAAFARRGVRRLAIVGDSLAHELALAVYARLCAAPFGRCTLRSDSGWIRRVRSPLLDLVFVRAPAYGAREDAPGGQRLHPERLAGPARLRLDAAAPVDEIWVGVSHWITQRKFPGQWVSTAAVDAAAQAAMEMMAREMGARAGSVVWVEGTRYYNGTSSAGPDLNRIDVRNAQARGVAAAHGQQFFSLAELHRDPPPAAHLGDGRTQRSEDELHWCYPGVPDDELDLVLNLRRPQSLNRF